MDRTETFGGKMEWKMKKTMLILVVVVLGCSFSTAHGTLVDITVSTDKPVYNFNEDVIVTVTATNPNPYSVTLIVSVLPTASYLMDDSFDWALYQTGLPAIVTLPFAPAQSHSWDMVHALYERSIYPLSLGLHSVIGELLVYVPDDDPPFILLVSDSLEFEVIPEPATFLLFAVGVLCFRRANIRSIK